MSNKKKFLNREYELVRELNAGGMSSGIFCVKRTSDTSKNPSLYIIKEIKKKEGKSANVTWEKAKDELRLTLSLSSGLKNNFVAYPVDYQLEENTITIVTEYVDGMTLGEYLKKKTLLNPYVAVEYIRQIIEGLKGFHFYSDKRSIIHRDLKIENIMISSDFEQIKIIDYGIATFTYDNILQSNEEAIYCSVPYSTPDVLITREHIKNIKSGVAGAQKKLVDIITFQFDIHSIGVILYQMLTGSLPMKYKEKMNDLQKISMWLNTDVPSMNSNIPIIPNSLENIVFRCTASKPEDLKYRYKDINELYADLSTWDVPTRFDEPLIKLLLNRIYPNNSAIDLAVINEETSFIKSKHSAIIIFSIMTGFLLAIIITIFVMGSI